MTLVDRERAVKVIALKLLWNCSEKECGEREVPEEAETPSDSGRAANKL